MFSGYDDDAAKRGEFHNGRATAAVQLNGRRVGGAAPQPADAGAAAAAVWLVAAPLLVASVERMKETQPSTVGRRPRAPPFRKSVGNAERALVVVSFPAW